MTVGIGLSLFILLVILGILAALIAFELQFRRRPGNKLEMTAGTWELKVYEPHHYLLVGNLELINHTRKLEIMVPQVWAEVTFLSRGSLEGLTQQVRITPCHPDAPARADGYWFGYIVKRKPTALEVAIDLRGDAVSQLQSAWVRMHYVTYGPQGRVPKVRHVVVPLEFPATDLTERWRPAVKADLLPIRTHLLTHLDDPVEVVKRYAMPHAQPGDIITLGETPVALMQGRFRHPTEIHPGWLARRLCYYFMPTSSLATACGLQALIDIMGPWRVGMAFVLGALAKKFLKRPGVFYQLAGEQARLIDDVTGTLPPYDQFIVLGPDQPQTIVDRIQQETGLGAAIVDANDLKAVKILAASSGLSSQFLEQALITNPAGNADEQTPLVLIRPTS